MIFRIYEMGLNVTFALLGCYAALSGIIIWHFETVIFKGQAVEESTNSLSRSVSN